MYNIFMKKSPNLKDMQNNYAKFIKARNWWKNPNPGTIITALLGELGELVDYYTLKENFDFLRNLSSKEKEALEFEFVDVIIYLINLANHSNIDLSSAYNKKVPLLEKKFPVGSNGSKEHDEYRKTGKNKNYK